MSGGDYKEEAVLAKLKSHLYALVDESKDNNQGSGNGRSAP
jgi:hypothetical protein